MGYNSDMTDNELIQMADAIDRFLMDQALDFEETPLCVTAVMLARLRHFNIAHGTEADYETLLDQAASPIEIELHTLH